MGPGWGVDLDEIAIAKYPATRSPTSGIWSGVAGGAAQVSDIVPLPADGEDTQEWDIQTSEGWKLAPFKLPRGGVSAGKKCSLQYEGCDSQVVFKRRLTASCRTKARSTQ